MKGYYAVLGGIGLAAGGNWDKLATGDKGATGTEGGTGTWGTLKCRTAASNAALLPLKYADTALWNNSNCLFITLT